jgi:glycosyltransferase involved in cell wall biosynthesis
MRVVLFDQATDGHHLEYATWLATYLRQAGDDVTFVTLAPPAPEANLEALTSVASIRYARPHSLAIGNRPDPLRRLWAWAVGCRFALDVAAQTRADVVHYLYLDRAELPIAFGELGRSTRIATFATLFWPYYVGSGDRPAISLKRAYHALVRHSVRRMLRRGTLDGLFVHSERTKALLLDSWGQALRDRLHVVPDPANRSEEIGVAASRACLSLPIDSPLILFFGRLRQDKGPDVLLQALTGLRGDWRAVFAGPAGWLGDSEVERYQRQLADPGRIIPRLRFVPDQEVPRYFEAADVIVLPYRHTFLGTSGVLQRSAAAGKPVIASDVGDVGEIVRTAGLGVVVEPENAEELRQALQRFLDGDAQQVSEVRERGRRYAEDNDWTVLGERVRIAYISSQLHRCRRGEA